MAEIETEVKLTVSEEDYRKILAVGHLLECREQLNVYLHDPGRLEEGLGYFRVRFETGKEPVATLKIPVGWEGGVRRMVEIEKLLRSLGPGLFPRPRRRVSVEEDLPGEMADHFRNLDITHLERLGWMRNRRCLVSLGSAGVVELDRTVLPDGSLQFEAEIETPRREAREALTSRVRELAASARLSRLGKFSRFLEVLRRESQGRKNPE